MISRRNVLSAAAAGRRFGRVAGRDARFGNPAEPPAKARSGEERQASPGRRRLWTDGVRRQARAYAPAGTASAVTATTEGESQDFGNALGSVAARALRQVAKLRACHG